MLSTSFNSLTSNAEKKNSNKTKAGNKGERASLNDVKSKKRFEAIQRLSARMRHRTGIVNNREKNRLQLTYRRIERAGDILNIRVNRVQTQLRKELHDIEASRRAYVSHPMSFHDERRRVERKALEKYAARGRYLFSMRAEVRKQSDAIDAYNPRLEKAKKLVEPARRASVQAMERGQLLSVSTTAVDTKTPKTRGKIILPPIEANKKSMRREMTNSTL